MSMEIGEMRMPSSRCAVSSGIVEVPVSVAMSDEPSDHKAEEPTKAEIERPMPLIC
jgi:hypothetical protein